MGCLPVPNMESVSRASSKQSRTTIYVDSIARWRRTDTMVRQNSAECVSTIYC